jgi:apolipoprotein D and lipocalin family protein
MNRVTVPCLIYYLFIAVFLINSPELLSAPKKTTNTVQPDIKRYMGVWYEIARMPNQFQQSTSHDAKADWELLSDGTITIVNSCLDKDNKIQKIEGVGKVPDPAQSCKLKVSFAPAWIRALGDWLSFSDYNILYVDPEYTYSVITSGNKHAWVISRKTTLSEENLDNAFKILSKQSFKRDSFLFTKHEPEAK